jgi:hypothetical protein
MASLIGLGGTGNLTTTETTSGNEIFSIVRDQIANVGGESTVVYDIHNNDATNNALIRVSTHQGSGSVWVPIVPGETKTFYFGSAVKTGVIIYGKSSSGTVSISGGVTGVV